MNKTNTIEDLINEGAALEKLGNYKESVSILDTAFDRAIAEDRSIIAAILNQRGVAKRMLQDYEGAMNDYTEVWNYTSSASDYQEILSRINLADIERVFRTDFEEAHEYLDGAKDRLDYKTEDWKNYEQEDLFLKIKLDNQRGLVYRAENKMDEALGAHKRTKIAARKYHGGDFDKVEGFRMFASACQNIASDALIMTPPDYDTAGREAEEAYVTFKSLGDQQGMYNCLGAMGNIARVQGDYEKAEMYFTDTMILAETLNSGRDITGAALNLAEIYLLDGAPNLAKENLMHFRDGILNDNDYTEHDMVLAYLRFKEVYRLYSDSELNIKDFDKVKEKFDSVMKA